MQPNILQFIDALSSQHDSIFNTLLRVEHHLEPPANKTAKYEYIDRNIFKLKKKLHNGEIDIQEYLHQASRHVVKNHKFEPEFEFRETDESNY